MGDWFQRIVDWDVALEDAEELAFRVRQWLVGQGIIGSTAMDCVLGADEGYPPGPNFALAFDGPDDGILDRRTNGLKIVVGKTVFDSGQGGIESIGCPRCGKTVINGDALEEGINAIGEWYDGKAGIVHCRHCGVGAPVTECVFDPPWGFGNLGFEFWNWPPLREAFVAELTERLGHRMVLVSGKL